MKYEAPLRVVRVPPITFTQMFEPRHNILPNVRVDIPKYVVSWLEHLLESNGPVHALMSVIPMRCVHAKMAAQGNTSVYTSRDCWYAICSHSLVLAGE